MRLLRRHAGLVGVDEAGRGALAGPVVAGAVAVTREFFDTAWCARHESRINDSKKLSAAAREQIFGELEAVRAKGHLAFAAGSATVLEIESANILGATKLAMRRALITVATERFALPALAADGLFAAAETTLPWRIAVDGRPLSGFPYAHDALVGGDGKSLVIALASIVAKVTRDRLLDDLDALYPQYGFRVHKGYGTEAHRAEITARGPCPVHRPTFLRKLLAADAPAETVQEELF